MTTSDGYASIDTRFGRAELTAHDDGIAIALAPIDAESSDKLRDVIASHLERFARTPFEARWSEG